MPAQHELGAISGRGVSLQGDLSFSSSEPKCVILTSLDALVRETRRSDSGVATMQSRIDRWIRDAMRSSQSGQGLVEYALLLVLLSIASIAILSALGSSITVLYSVANVFTAP